MLKKEKSKNEKLCPAPSKARQKIKQLLEVP